MHKQKLELNMPQLTIAKRAQLGRHDTVTTSEHYSPRVARSIPVRGKFFAESMVKSM